MTTKLAKLTTKLVRLVRAAQGVFDLKLVVDTQSQTKEENTELQINPKCSILARPGVRLCPDS